MHSLASDGDKACNSAQRSYNVLNVDDIEIPADRPYFPSRGVLLAHDLLAHADLHDLLPPLDEILGLCLGG